MELGREGRGFHHKWFGKHSSKPSIWITLLHAKDHTLREMLPVPAALPRLLLDPLPFLISLSGSNIASSRVGLSLPVFLRGHSCSTLSLLYLGKNGNI